MHMRMHLHCVDYSPDKLLLVLCCTYISKHVSAFFALYTTFTFEFCKFTINLFNKLAFSVHMLATLWPSARTPIKYHGYTL